MCKPASCAVHSVNEEASEVNEEASEGVILNLLADLAVW